jgi:hypothetical protein
VTNISDGAFCDCSKLTSITIGESVSSIGGNAFSGCFKLANIVLKATTVDTWLQKIPINGGQITLGSNVNKIVADAFLYKNDVLLKALAPTPPLLESALPIESVEVLKGSTCDYALAENWN